ncbi:hypothetical protein D3C72_1963240 [compost metagenome]
MTLEYFHCLDQLARASTVAYAPTGHRMAFGYSVDGQRTVFQPRLDLRNGAICEIVIDQVLIDVIAHHQHMFVAQEHLSQRAQLVLTVSRARGIGWRIQDHPLGFGRNGSG